MHSPNRISLAVIAEDFAVPGPAQQLADRFLFGLGSRSDQGPPDPPAAVAVHLTGGAPAGDVLASRARMGLKVCDSRAQALEGAQAVVIAGRRESPGPSASLIAETLAAMPAATPCFVHGLLADTGSRASQLMAAATHRGIPLLAGTPIATTWRLPDVDVSQGSAVSEALILVPGPGTQALPTGIEGLQPWLERRRGGESGVVRVHHYRGGQVWKTGLLEGRTGQLLAAALSRSDSPQGDSITDGRTQDVFGKGLVPTLARDPHLWVLEHRDGLVSRVAAFDGVINDVTLAIRVVGSRIVSAQLYRPPPPTEAHYDRLVEAIRRFVGGKAPWAGSRAIRMAEMLELAAGAAAGA